MRDAQEDKAPADTGGATDGQLFALMARGGEAGKEAWAVFYLRYVGDLRRLVCRVRGLPQGGVDELVQDAMVQAYRAARTFRADDSLDADAARRRTLAWLGRVARNLYWSLLRQRRGVTFGSLDGLEDEGGARLSNRGRPLAAGELYREIRTTEEHVAGDSDADGETLRRRLVREALGTLSERERDILVETYEYYERGQKQQRLPQAAVAKICAAHDIKPAYLRQLRKRAHEKIEHYVAARMPAES